MSIVFWDRFLVATKDTVKARLAKYMWYFTDSVNVSLIPTPSNSRLVKNRLEDKILPCRASTATAY